MQKTITMIIVVLLILSAALLGASITLFLNPSRSAMIKTIPVLNTNPEIVPACNYLVSNYNATRGLISETPAHEKYWLYSDNYLASIAFKVPCKRPDLATTINNTLLQYSRYPNQYQVLTSPFRYFNGSQDRNLSGSIWTTINNGTGPALSPNDYADIAFLQAYNSTKWSHNSLTAQKYFQMGAGLFNGTGFVDRPFEVSSKPQFQIYKLALYIYLATILNDTVPTSVLINLGRMQSSTGGFYTGYVADYSANGTSTNTETTSLAIMALASLTSSANYIQTSLTSQVNQYAAPLLELGIGAGITAIVMSVWTTLSQRRRGAQKHGPPGKRAY